MCYLVLRPLGAKCERSHRSLTAVSGAVGTVAGEGRAGDPRGGLHEGLAGSRSRGPTPAGTGDSALPAVPVDDLVERPAVGLGQRPEWPIGRVPQADHVGGPVAVWQS